MRGRIMTVITAILCALILIGLGLIGYMLIGNV